MLFKKLKNKIDNHFIRLTNSTLDNKLFLINQKIDNVNANLNTTNNRIIETKTKLDIDISTYVKAAILHQKTFLQFKDYCNGKKLVICGAGPSLSKYKPIDGAIHIALNRAILFNKVHFDFFFAQDFRGISMIMHEIIDYKNCIKLFAEPFQDSKFFDDPSIIIPEDFAIKSNALRFYLGNTIHGSFNNPFIKDIDKEPLSGHYSVGHSVLQFAVYMNPTDIYLVGYDLSGSHFTHQNQGELEKNADENYSANHWKNEYENQKNKFKEFKEFKNQFYPNIKIHSINPTGLKGVFDDIYQEGE